MARIPQYQEQFISTRVADPTAGALGENIAKVGQLGMQAINIYEQKKIASDMTKVAELSTDFELALQDDYNEMSEQRSSNPEGFGKDFNKHIQERKKEFSESSGLGSQARLAFNEIAERQRGNFGVKAIDFENERQVFP